MWDEQGAGGSRDISSRARSTAGLRDGGPILLSLPWLLSEVDVGCARSVVAQNRNKKSPPAR